MKKATLLLLALGFGINAQSASTKVDQIKSNTDIRVREIINPLLGKYCNEQCKLLSVETQVDVAIPEQIAPGFDDLITEGSVTDLAPTSVKAKILMDSLVGPITREKIVTLINENLSALEYPVTLDIKSTAFPIPLSMARKITALRQRVETEFKSNIDQLFSKFCPEQCMLGDFKVEVDPVNAEEAQYGSAGEFIQDGDAAVRVRDIQANIMLDDSLTPAEQANVIEMARLKSTGFKNVAFKTAVMHFPNADGTLDTAIASKDGVVRATRGLASSLKEENKSALTSNSKATENLAKTETSATRASDTLNASKNETQKVQTDSSENNQRQERFERFEKIERVENGDAVQAQLKQFQNYALVFACAVIALLVFLAMAAFRPAGKPQNSIQRIIKSLTPESGTGAVHSPESAPTDRALLASKRYEIERLMEELTTIFAEQPKVAKQVFSRILKEEGVETSAAYISLFGEAIVLEMLRDPSLQTDLADLTEFYAKNPIEINDDEKLDLLKALHNRTVAAKMIVIGNRSARLFDFLVEMDALQILELVRNESLTVKAIVMTQCDSQKRTSIFQHLDEATRMNLLTELSRIDYLPRDYIYNVANALKRKRKENPRLNTEALPGSDVLINLLERVTLPAQRNVIKSLEAYNPESARAVKSKLVSLDTLPYMRDAQLLEVVLSLKHEELLQFLKGAPGHIRETVYQKSPRDLVVELEEELGSLPPVSRDTYQNVERKILNRVKIMANDGVLNLIELNERMFSDAAAVNAMVGEVTGSVTQGINKVAGW